jgi:crotonobetainyl-CoA:carnitine CoA-transferase CaiB-like acyl-CoA transferase
VSVRLLSELRVLELGGGTAGAIAGAQLAELGASVSKLREADGEAEPPAPLFTGADGARASVLLETVDAGKRLLPAGGRDEVRRWAAESDVVICDRIARPPGCLSGPVDAYVADVRSLNRSVWTTVSAFGLSGPRRHESGSDLACLASAGVVARSRTNPELLVGLPGRQGYRSAAQVAVLASLHGLDRFRRSGAPCHLDVSCQEAIIATGPVLELAHLLFDCPGAAGARRYAPGDVFECRDGFVQITAPENHHWSGLMAALGEPDWAMALGDGQARMAAIPVIEEGVGRWTRERSKRQAAATLQASGVPAAPVNTIADVLASEQFLERRAFIGANLRGRHCLQPRPPFLFDASSASAPPPPRPMGLAGLRVLEVTHVLAAPMAGSLLGAMGAEVLKAEDPERLDMYRRGPYAEGLSGIDRGGYFTVINHSKASVTAAITAGSTKLEALLGSAEVLIENLGVRRARQVGVDCGGAASRHRGLLALSSSGFGNTGPLAGDRAYALELLAYAGLFDLDRDPDGHLCGTRLALADLWTSFVIATVVAAWAVGGGEAACRGAAVDLSMAEVVLDRLSEYVADATLDRAGTEPATVVPSPVVTPAQLLADGHLAAREFFPEVEHPVLGRRRVLGLPWRFESEGALPLGQSPRFGGVSGFAAAQAPAGS